MQSVVRIRARGLYGILAVACTAVAVALQACDACAGKEGVDRASCCSQDSDAPSCAVDATGIDECGSSNGDAESACILLPGEPYSGRFNAGGDHDDDFFALVVDPNATSVDVRVAIDAADDSAPARRIGVRVLDELGTVLTELDRVVDEERAVVVPTLGVRHGARYHVVVRTYAELSYSIEASFGSEPLEIEPNDAAELATTLPRQSTITGSSFPLAGRPDYDFFRMTSGEQDQNVDVGLRHLGGSRDANLEIAVLDESETELCAEVVAAGDDGMCVVGVVAESNYIVRVGREVEDGTTPFDYELSATFDSDLFEIEPNDTTANAQPLAMRRFIRGAYSASHEGADDDVFMVELQTDSSALEVQLSPAGTFSLALFDAEEAIVETEVAVDDGRETFTAAGTGGGRLFVRVRSEPIAAGLEYRLRVDQP